MKKLFTLIIAATMTAAAWATDTNYSPTAEYNVRPLADGTAWKAAPTSAADKATFECTASACFYAIQQYTVANIQDATSMTLVLTNDATKGGSDALAIWAFNGTFAADMSASDFNTAFKNTTGVDAGGKGTHTTTYLLKDVTTVKNPSKFTIDGTALTQLKSMAGTDGSFTLLITNKTADIETNGTAQRKYQSNNSANANPPVLTVTTPSDVVTNLTTGEGYTDFATAVSAASANDVLQLNENISVSSRINTTVAMTIQGMTGSEVITCATNATTMLFLPGENAPLTLKNMVLDGNGTTRTAAAIEASNTLLTMEGVTVQNFTRKQDSGKTNQGFICIKTKGSVVLDGCTFKDNTLDSDPGYGDVFVGLSNALTLKGCNAIDNGIYVEKALYINDGGTTHTSPITVIAASNRESSTGLGSNKAFIKGTVDTYKYTLSGNAAWDIAGNETDNWLYVAKAASTTLSNDKTMSSGKGYKIGTIEIK